MNFLAHIYLSGSTSELMLGNFIGDFVKGKQYEKFSPQIQKGILLHRKIDYFADTHQIVKKSASRFKEPYGRYASVVIDVIYDHYLASLWNNYSDIELDAFVSQTHRFLMKNYFTLPTRVKGFLPFLIKSRRLENYKNISDIERTLSIMANNTSLPEKSKEAVKVLEANYYELESEFIIFFDEIRAMAEHELNKAE